MRGALLLLLPGMLACASCSPAERPLNGAAVIPIYGVSAEALAVLSGHDYFPDIMHPQDIYRTQVRGFYWHTLTPPREALYVCGVPNPAAWILLHEYQHLLEQHLQGDVAAQRIIRHAFRSVNSVTFEIGHADLLTELP